MPHEVLKRSLCLQLDFNFLRVYDDSLGLKNSVFLFRLGCKQVQQRFLVCRIGANSYMGVVMCENTIIRQSSWSLTLVNCLDKSKEGLVDLCLFVVLLILGK